MLAFRFFRDCSSSSRDNSNKPHVKKTRSDTSKGGSLETALGVSTECHFLNVSSFRSRTESLGRNYFSRTFRCTVSEKHPQAELQSEAELGFPTACSSWTFVQNHSQGPQARVQGTNSRKTRISRRSPLRAGSAQNEPFQDGPAWRRRIIWDSYLESLVLSKPLVFS
ncbi:hypothetical protein CEXT_434841 [Caerostris extrusa]|uniref:Uncharacterized protein n=1 Tax=Caerostris extrusa TaxID=172846 RepID=A0AAV4REY5_CAEEX|nr:hypothetical protein CEXT_434841 [Caerostris extrusa]